MLKLCGFAASNYYNKVKFALLEKGIAFEEVQVWGGNDPACRGKTPLGKIPFIEDGGVVLSESQAIVEYLEAAYPDKPLLPRDAKRAAKVRELIMYSEIYLEWEARRVYSEAFFGRKVSEDIKTLTGQRLEDAFAGLFGLTRFEPYAAGSEFTLADCALGTHLPLVGLAASIVYQRDYLADERIKNYLALLAERPSVRKIAADRKANLEAFMGRARTPAT
jgi:glutathione S-transferase